MGSLAGLIQGKLPAKYMRGSDKLYRQYYSYSNNHQKYPTQKEKPSSRKSVRIVSLECDADVDMSIRIQKRGAESFSLSVVGNFPDVLTLYHFGSEPQKNEFMAWRLLGRV